jgi:hypothetical protein
MYRRFGLNGPLAFTGMPCRLPKTAKPARYRASRESQGRLLIFRAAARHSLYGIAEAKP